MGSKKGPIEPKKHRISFEVALTAFDDPMAVIKSDPKHSWSEVRSALIGLSDDGVLFIIFTIRGMDGIFRIISARKANRKERMMYEESK